jgi:aryl-alcohol dehydrogenase-like predicted oxidoreductase
MQNHYNLLYREEEREMMPTLKARCRASACVPFTYFSQHFGVGSIPWSPLGRGLLTRPFDSQSQRSESDPWIGIYKSDSSADIVGR